MALFGTPEEKEAKNEEKMRKLMEKYELQNLSSEYQNAVKNINQELAGSKLFEAGMKIGMNYKPEDMLKIQYLHAIMEQNWIIIRLLDELKSK